MTRPTWLKCQILGVEECSRVPFFPEALGTIAARVASVHVIPGEDAIAVEDLAGPVGKPRSSFTRHREGCTMREVRIEAKNGGTIVESAYVKRMQNTRSGLELC